MYLVQTELGMPARNLCLFVHLQIRTYKRGCVLLCRNASVRHRNNFLSTHSYYLQTFQIGISTDIHQHKDYFKTGGVYANSQSKGNQRAIDILATTALAERAERVNHQNNQTPNNLDIIRIITNAQSGAGAGAGANASALAQAEALALLLNGGSGRNGQVNPQPVALYQPAMPCCCNTGCGCNQ